MENNNTDAIVTPPIKLSFWEKKWVRITLWFLGGLIALVLTIVLLPLVMGFFVRDISPVNDSDVLPVRIDVPSDQNAFYDLVAIEGLIHDPTGLDTHFISASTNERDAMLVDKISMEKFLNENNDAFSHFDNAARKLNFQEPYNSDPILINANQKIASLSTWRMASRLNLIRAEYLSSVGAHDDAMSAAMNGVLVGRHIMSSTQPTLIAYLVGIAVDTVALQAIERITASSTLTSTSSRTYTNMLNGAEKNTSGLVGAFKSEYQNQKTTIAKVAAGDTGTVGEVPTSLAKYSYYFQPNRTIQLFAETARKQISKAEQPCSQLIKENYEYLQYEYLIEKPWTIYFENNAVGKILDLEVGSSLGTVFEKKCSDVSRANAVQLLIALKAYKNEHGELPVKLDMLVPVYISQIPEDPFANKPMNYDARKKIIYSVGTDLTDNGGDAGLSLDWYTMKDQVLKISF